MPPNCVSCLVWMQLLTLPSQILAGQLTKRESWSLRTLNKKLAIENIHLHQQKYRRGWASPSRRLSVLVEMSSWAFYASLLPWMNSQEVGGQPCLKLFLSCIRPFMWARGKGIQSKREELESGLFSALMSCMTLTELLSNSELHFIHV